MSVVSLTVQTPRLKINLLDTGGEGQPVLFIHGNISTGEFYAPTLLSLPPTVRGLAPDLRGFGATEPKPIDATRGVRDFADDLHALVEQMHLTGSANDGHRLILVGWSVGGAVALQYAIDHPDEVAGILLEAPMSPFGFGGTRDAAGTPCYPDYAGAGAGTASPAFVAAMRAGDRTSDTDNSPRRVINQFLFKPPFRVGDELEDALVAEMLKTRTGDDHYPGDGAGSANWPGVSPGRCGMNNAISPRYTNLSGFAKLKGGPKVLWVRGDADQIVSDTSVFDFGFLGKLGVVPGWPGEEAYPPQPMVGQMRALLDRYRENGNSYEEVVLSDCGHSPHLEKPQEFHRLLLRFCDDCR